MTILLVEGAVRTADGEVIPGEGGQPGMWTSPSEMTQLLVGAWGAIAFLQEASEFVEEIRVFFEFNAEDNLETAFEVEYLDYKGRRTRVVVYRINRKKLQSLSSYDGAKLITEELRGVIRQKLFGMVEDMKEDTRRASQAVDHLYR